MAETEPTYPPRIALMGLPGSGKSTLGRALAADLGYAFIDLDAEIEAAEGARVPEIFHRQGEAAFRQYEQAALQRVLERPGPWVLATGGGTPCFFDNLARLNAAAVTLWLDVPLPVLRKRLAPGTERPLLAQNPTRLAELAPERRPRYAQAHIRVAGAAVTVEDLLSELAN